jgi:hypothetical protein
LYFVSEIGLVKFAWACFELLILLLPPPTVAGVRLGPPHQVMFHFNVVLKEVVHVM